MSGLNILFAVLFGAGVFAVFVGLSRAQALGKTDLEQITGRPRERRSTLDRLRERLVLAGIEVDPAQFIMISFSLGAAVGGGLFLLSGAFLAGILGFVGGVAWYGAHLSGQARKAIEDYEDSLPDAFDLLRTAMVMYSNIYEATQEVAEHGPRPVREDWRYIATQLHNAADEKVLGMAFSTVAAKRKSLILTHVFENIEIHLGQGGGLKDILPDVVKNLRERVSLLQRARTAMKSPLRNLTIICFMPIVVVFILRVIAPGYAIAYSSLPGQLILLLGWGISLGAYWYGNRVFGSALEEDNDFGVVEMGRAGLEYQPPQPKSQPR